MVVCSKICNECPFSNKSLNGWLADYTIDDIVIFQNKEVSFPCHKMVNNDNLTQVEVENKILNGDMKLCRGYVESIIKSCKSPYINKLLVKAINEVKVIGLSDDSMSIWEFKKHHEKFK
jgi:hypothetical protein